MTHSDNILAVNRMFQDITKVKDEFFGGKIIIFCGDPRQTLPVIPKGSRSVVVKASLMKCPLIWDSATELNLSINMRVIRNGNNPQAIAFARYLLDVGENNQAIERINNTDIIRIPNALLIHNELPNTPETLINVIFPNIYSGIIINDSPKNCPISCCRPLPTTFRIPISLALFTDLAMVRLTKFIHAMANMNTAIPERI